MNKQIASNPYAFKVDLSNCDNEPIHLIPHLQHHACLVACDPANLEIIHVSKNTNEKIGLPYESLIGQHLSAVLDKSTLGIIKKAIEEKGELRLVNPLRVGFEAENVYLSYNLIVHLHNNKVICEFEPYDETVSSTKYQHLLSKVISNVQSAKELPALYETAANELRKLTGYDRVMVYKFAENGDGAVIAESKTSEIEPFLGLNYPASDIPKQARVLFLKNKVRLTSDILSTPVEIFPMLSPSDNKPLDLTYAVARGVSPIHLEYLSNMGVQGTLSISIENNGKLWGLFACHHYSPKVISFDLRNTCEFIGQIFSGHLSLHAASIFRSSILQANLTKSRLFEQMSEDWNIINGLFGKELNVKHLVDCSGVCVIIENKKVSLGKVPDDDQLDALVKWLDQKGNSTQYHTNKLSSEFPGSKAYKEVASGILAINIMPQSSNYIIWFRPEVIQEVSWGGKPQKAVESSEDGLRLSPRKSFEKWTQMVTGSSTPWKNYEIEVTIALRNDIKESIFKKFKEVQAFNKELSRAYQELESFSYSVSHDLRAPLRSINGFAQILLEDYMDNLDSYGQSVVHTILRSTEQMNMLIDDMLAFSKVGQSQLIINELNLKQVIEDKIEELMTLQEYNKKPIKFIIQPDLPLVYADATMFGQVIHNLLSNALKYSANEEEVIIEVKGKIVDDSTQFYVKDNGIGFDMKYSNQIFKVFTRLVGEDKFEGNGIGLAIVKRIIDKHKGEIIVNSQEGVGTSFTIKLPNIKRNA